MDNIISLKAYGDFVIACSALKKLKTTGVTNKVRLVAGEHLRPLARAIHTEDTTYFIGSTIKTDVPAAFNIRRAGLLEGLKSLYHLHQDLRSFPSQDRFVFDHLGWREKILTTNLTAISLNQNIPNIYLAYHEFLESQGYQIQAKTTSNKKNFEKVFVIPGARWPYRTIPSTVLKKIYKNLDLLKIDCEIIIFEDEDSEHLRSLPVRKIPRDFYNLVSTVRSAKFIISADSLPAHLADFFEIPIYVFCRDLAWSKYWIPISAYLSDGISSFTDEHSLTTWLTKNSADYI